MNTQRAVESTRTTSVVHVAKPSGPTRENGPHLADLRAFVTACEGLPDGLVVSIHNGYLGESGRRDVFFRVTQREPITEDVTP